MRILFAIFICGILLSMGCTGLSGSKCSDGTLEKNCSVNKPFYCAGGELLKNAEKCGCPVNSSLSNGNCVTVCSDGTEMGTCGMTRPDFCLNGTLVSDPIKCGCIDSRYDIIDNTCIIKRCIDDTGLGGCSKSNISYFCSSGGMLVPDPAKCGCGQGYSLYSSYCWKNCPDGTLGGKCSAKDNRFCMNGTLVTDFGKCSCPSDQVLCNNSCKTPQCRYDSDCDDGYALTEDKCLNPNACNAICNNQAYDIVIMKSYDDPIILHDLRIEILSIDDLGRYIDYDMRNGTASTFNTSSSKKIIAVSVSIEARDDYDYEVSQSSFYLIDDENITYKPVCPTKSNKLSSTSTCNNDNAFPNSDYLSDNDDVEGMLYFDIPRYNDPGHIGFKFDPSLKPREVRFRYG
jgi:hypothetical protein